MKQDSNQVNSIPPRANAKLVEVNARKFLLGGLTADKVTNDIYQIRIVEEEKNSKIQYRLLKFKNNLFKPRNSFSACGSPHNKIYIWGGLQSNQTDQKCLNDLIELDLDKLEMKQLVLKQPINIHSSALIYDPQQNQLLAIGGTNESSTMESFLYRLNIDIGEEEKHQWKKTRINCPQHNGYLWQHTAHLSLFSYFSGKPGKFLTVVGGCRYPQSPYNSIVQFDLKSMTMCNSVKIKYGLVTHDSVCTNEAIMIVGGVTGGDYSSERLFFSQGKVQYKSGHKAIGCSCCQDEKAYYVIGGASDLKFNNVVIYKKNGE